MKKEKIKPNPKKAQLDALRAEINAVTKIADIKPILLKLAGLE